MNEQENIPKDAEREDFPQWAQQQSRQEGERWDRLDEIRHANDRRWLRAYGWIVLVLTVLFSCAFVVAFFVWGWHYTAKNDWTWLSAAQLDKLQSVIFSGGMGAMVSGVLRAQMAKIA